VVRQALRWAVAGVAIGAAAALGVTRALDSLLFGVGAGDPATFVGVALLLPAVLLLASLGPAWRAARSDPWKALRHE
jgi:putative ABC transport system permease protein